jgi:hypothetical protein
VLIAYLRRWPSFARSLVGANRGRQPMRDPIFRTAGTVTQRHVWFLTPPADRSARMTRAIAGGGACRSRRCPVIGRRLGALPQSNEARQRRPLRNRSGPKSGCQRSDGRPIALGPRVTGGLGPKVRTWPLRFWGILVATDFVVARAFDVVGHEPNSSLYGCGKPVLGRPCHGRGFCGDGQRARRRGGRWRLSPKSIRRAGLMGSRTACSGRLKRDATPAARRRVSAGQVC